MLVGNRVAQDELPSGPPRPSAPPPRPLPKAAAPAAPQRRKTGEFKATVAPRNPDPDKTLVEAVSLEDLLMPSSENATLEYAVPMNLRRPDGSQVRASAPVEARTRK